MTHALRPIRSVITALGPPGVLGAAVVVPARNEQRRITACLDALGVAICKARPLTTGIVVVINNTEDTTSERVLAWAAAHSDISLQVIDCTFLPQDAHVGAGRRLGLDHALNHIVRDGILLTTDADSRVRPGWISRNHQALSHADLICGAFAADKDEVRTLPPAVAMHCHIESAYMSVAVKLAALLDPLPHDPDPPHLNASGASLAFTRQLYEAVGGMPVIAMSEDRAFAARAERHDFRVRHCNTVMVDTSCRMTGRTGGGMAGALRERAIEADPQVDQWLEPADTFARRYQLRGRLRAAWPDSAALAEHLCTALGPRDATRLMPMALPETFGAFSEHVEANSAALERVRMRISDCRGELQRLTDLYSAFSYLNQAFSVPHDERRRAL